MGYADSSDKVLLFAFWTGVVALGLTLLLVLQVVLMRVLFNLREKRKSVFLQEWRQYIIEAVVGNIPPLPGVSRANVPFLLNLWNHYQESLRGDARLNLQRFALAVAMDKLAGRLMKSRNVANQMLAIMTLGNMRYQPAWSVLELKLVHRNPLVSLAAARALMQIDAAAAVGRLIEILAVRDDWAPVRVATMMKEAGAEVISEPLVARIRQAPDEVLARLIPYLEFAYSNSSSELIISLLQSRNDPSIITACLRVLNSAQEIPLVRKFARHADWYVRVQAVAALGRLGTVEELPLILELMRDAQWWVRYRAAQALVSLPFITPAQLQHYQQTETDLFARNMLEQVMAERRA